MAGGLGKRMKSDIPKVLHMLGDQPILVHVVRSAIGLAKEGENLAKILIIVGKYAPEIAGALEKYLLEDELSYIEYVFQHDPKGTGHAVQQILPSLERYPKSSKVMVLSGDVPLIRTKTLLGLLATYDHHEKAEAVLITTVLDNPTGNGRILRGPDRQFDRIVEEKDATESEKMVTEVNAGIYLFNAQSLCEQLPLIKNDNAQKEYYLPDVLPLLMRWGNRGGKILSYVLDREDQYELLNINDQEGLREAERKIKYMFS